MTLSNEHPDMSGNPADAPFICDMCGAEVREDRLFGSVHNDELNFCSGECVESWEESQRHDEY